MAYTGGVMAATATLFLIGSMAGIFPSVHFENAVGIVLAIMAGFVLMSLKRD